MMKLNAFRMAAGLMALCLTGAAQAGIAVKGGTVYTMTGEPLSDGVVLVDEGRIEAVGAAGEVSIPDGYEVHEAAVVTPGLIDAHSVVGLAGLYNVPADQDQLDTTAPIQPGLRALDAYNAREDLVGWLRSLGVTTVHTGPAPGALVSGQTMLVKTRGETVDEASIRDVAAVAFTLGAGVSNHFDSPGTRAKGMAMIRQALQDARAYGRKVETAGEGKGPDRDLGKEALVRVLNGELPALITANTAVDIMSALRLAREFDLDLILDGAADVYMVLDEVKEAGVPVLLHPTMTRPSGEQSNAAFDTAAKLRDAGVPFAIKGGYESYVPKTRVVLFEAAIAAANGLTKQQALASITSSPAAILGLDEQVGSLEAGKDADLALFDGDPLEYTTHACKVFIQGELVSEKCR